MSKTTKKQWFFLTELDNQEYFIDFEYCEELFFKNLKFIEVFLIKYPKVILNINLPSFSENHIQAAKGVINDLNIKYTKKLFFCVNDYGILLYLQNNKYDFYLGRIILNMFKHIKKPKEELPSFLIENRLGGVMNNKEQIDFLIGKKNISIEYNYLISVSLECKHKKCEHDCLGWVKVSGMNKSMDLYGKNLYLTNKQTQTSQKEAASF